MVGILPARPTEPSPGKTVIWDEASVGLLQVFLDSGYEVVAFRPCAGGSCDTDSPSRRDRRARKTGRNVR